MPQKRKPTPLDKKRPATRKRGGFSTSQASKHSSFSVGSGLHHNKNTGLGTGRSTSRSHGVGSASPKSRTPHPRLGDFADSLGLGGGPNGGFNPEVVLTRRNLLIGAGAVGGLALVGAGGSAAINAFSDKKPTIETLSVPIDAVTQLDALTQMDQTSCVSLVGKFKLPKGSLVFADALMAACLVPGETSTPLNTVRVLGLKSGNSTTVLKSAQSSDEGFEIFDARCSEDGLIWTECNIYENRWRIYAGQLNGAELSAIQKVDEGDGNILTPSIAAAGKRAFWQIVPSPTGEHPKDPSILRSVIFGSTDTQDAYTSNRSFATRVTPAGDGVVITPRAEGGNSYYSLTKILASDLSIADQLTLPVSMTPDEASYVSTGFSFAFSNIYNYGDGIANLGTYAPTTTNNAWDYQGKKWFRFGRTPSAPAASCSEWFVVKSTRAITGVHFDTNNYFMIEPPSDTDSYGEYLISTGNHPYIVGCSQIVSTQEKVDDHTLIRVYSPKEGLFASAKKDDAAANTDSNTSAGDSNNDNSDNQDSNQPDKPQASVSNEQ